MTTETTKPAIEPFAALRSQVKALLDLVGDADHEVVEKGRFVLRLVDESEAALLREWEAALLREWEAKR